ncbi:MAG: hypothetical protein GKR91_07195 [Pseudomonadales bacterium]|nr:hypothetical protein [Pseudomonadales bacterium]
MGSLLEELKRRKVFRVAAVYAVVAWLLIEVADVVLPTFGAPDWVAQTIIFLFVLGFPLAMVLAWAYDITPGGIKPESVEQTAPSSAATAAQPINYVILAIVLLVAGFQVADRFLLGPVSNSNLNRIASDMNTSSMTDGEPVVRASIALGLLSPVRQNYTKYASFRLSPDGSKILYASAENQQTPQLFIRDIDQFQSRPLGPQLSALAIPEIAYSPNGEWVAYVDGDILKKTAIDSGTTLIISEIVANVSLYWAEDDRIIFNQADFGLAYVSASGGELETLNIPPEPDRIEAHLFPEILPGTDMLMFTRADIPGGAVSNARIELFNLNTQESLLLINNAYNATYSNSGHIVFMRDESLWAVPFDPIELKTTGEEFQLIDSVYRIETLGLASYSLSNNGDLVYLSSEGLQSTAITPRNVLTWVNRDGTEIPIDLPPRTMHSPRLSPDGSQVVVTVVERSGQNDMWNYDLERGTFSRITFSDIGTSFGIAIWHPDGERLVYGNLTGLHSVRANGVGAIESVMPSQIDAANLVVPTGFSPDGTELLYQVVSGPFTNRRGDISVLDLAPEQTRSDLLSSEYYEVYATISPNGRWMSYSSNESGVP